MASTRQMVRRKRRIKSFAGMATGAAKFTIEPLTRNAYQYAIERVPKYEGILKKSLSWDVRGTTGAIKVRSGKEGGNHWYIVEHGTVGRSHDNGKYVGVMPAQPYLRPAVAKAKREIRNHWRAGWKEAEREQSTGS